MIRNSLIIILLAIFGLFLFQGFSEYRMPESLNRTAEYYNTNAAGETGAANAVTAIVVTYRGLDTLGEVTVLFLAAGIVGFILHKRGGRKQKENYRNSEILETASKILVPGSIVLGTYIFINGHLTPGGGFQGGAVIGTAILLIALAVPGKEFSHRLLSITESLSGAFYVLIGLLGIVLAGGFLDNRILPLGEVGELFSAGAIPVIYSLIGIKVGTELSGIINDLNATETQED